MTSTVVVRSVSGVLFEMDVPAAGHARDLWDHRLANGDLVVVVDPVVWVDVAGGGRQLVLATGVPAEAPGVASGAPRRGRPPKVREFAESAVEAPPVEGE